MELITEADKVVRTFLPSMLEAMGRSEYAQELRNSDPLKGPKSVIRAAVVLNGMKSDDDDPWQEIVEDALFWCEAAVWAASRDDVKGFRNFVDRATSAMREGLVPLQFH